MGIVEKSVALHAEGFNCAQGVFAALAEPLGIDELAAKQLAAGFGGGLRCGEACGALCGAIMALGIAAAKDGTGSKDAPVAELTRRLTAQFREAYGALRCEELLAKTGGSHERCDTYISYCAQLAAELIGQQANANRKGDGTHAAV